MMQQDDMYHNGMLVKNKNATNDRNASIYLKA